MMLFTFQIGSSALTIGLALAVPQILRSNFYCIDFTINLFCAYLQFGFAENHYRKCCWCSDLIIRSMTSRWIKRKIFALTLTRSGRRIPPPPRRPKIMLPSTSTPAKLFPSTLTPGTTPVYPTPGSTPSKGLPSTSSPPMTFPCTPTQPKVLSPPKMMVPPLSVASDSEDYDDYE